MSWRFKKSEVKIVELFDDFNVAFDPGVVALIVIKLPAVPFTSNALIIGVIPDVKVIVPGIDELVNLLTVKLPFSVRAPTPLLISSTGHIVLATVKVFALADVMLIVLAEPVTVRFVLVLVLKLVPVTVIVPEVPKPRVRAVEPLELNKPVDNVLPFISNVPAVNVVVNVDATVSES